MNEKKIRIRFINQNREVYTDENEKTAEQFKTLIRNFLLDPDAVVFETRINDLPCLMPKGFINNCYIVYEEINPNNLEKIASLI